MSEIDRFTRMENWLIENGAKFPKLILKVNAVKEMQQTYTGVSDIFSKVTTLTSYYTLVCRTTVMRCVLVIPSKR